MKLPAKMKQYCASFPMLIFACIITGCAAQETGFEDARRDMILMLQNDQHEQFVKNYNWQYAQYQGAHEESEEALENFLIDVLDARFEQDLRATINMSPTYRKYDDGEQIICYRFNANQSSWRDIVFRNSEKYPGWRILVPSYHVIP